MNRPEPVDRGRNLFFFFFFSPSFLWPHLRMRNKNKSQTPKNIPGRNRGWEWAWVLNMGNFYKTLFGSRCCENMPRGSCPFRRKQGWYAQWHSVCSVASQTAGPPLKLHSPGRSASAGQSSWQPRSAGPGRWCSHRTWGLISWDWNSLKPGIPGPCQRPEDICQCPET